MKSTFVQWGICHGGFFQLVVLTKQSQHLGVVCHPFAGSHRSLFVGNVCRPYAQMLGVMNRCMRDAWTFSQAECCAWDSCIHLPWTGSLSVVSGSVDLAQRGSWWLTECIRPTQATAAVLKILTQHAGIMCSMTQSVRCCTLRLRQ